MSVVFGINDGAIIVTANLWRSVLVGDLSMVLDTGAELTVVNSRLLRGMGIPIPPDAKRIPLNTASGSQIGLKVVIPKFKALGKTRTNFEIVCYELPKAIGCDGLLGLDFFRGFELNINFKTGQIQLK